MEARLLPRPSPTSERSFGGDRKNVCLRKRPADIGTREQRASRYSRGGTTNQSVRRLGKLSNIFTAHGSTTFQGIDLSIVYVMARDLLYMLRTNHCVRGNQMKLRTVIAAVSLALTCAPALADEIKISLVTAAWSGAVGGSRYLHPSCTTRRRRRPGHGGLGRSVPSQHATKRIRL